MSKKIILASKSPRRKELLSQIGFEYECIVSDTEEIITESEPDKVVMRLAEEKAKAVIDKCNMYTENCIIIGADTVVAKDGIILGKPKDANEAFNMLSELSGDGHIVYTGVCMLVYENNNIIDKISFAEATKVYMYDIAEEEINSYIETGEPMDKAGSYGIQGVGASFIKKIEGDYNNVVGLPIGRIYQEIKKYKY